MRNPKHNLNAYEEAFSVRIKEHEMQMKCTKDIIPFELHPHFLPP